MRNFIKVSDDTMNQIRRLAKDTCMSYEDLIVSMVSSAETKLQSSRFKTHDDWLFIKARYTTTCPICTYKVWCGKPTYWKPGQKAIHPECRNKDLETKKARSLSCTCEDCDGFGTFR